MPAGGALAPDLVGDQVRDHVELPQAPRCTGPDGLIPDATVGASPGYLRSASARTCSAVRATQSSAGATGQADLHRFSQATAYKQSPRGLHGIPY